MTSIDLHFHALKELMSRIRSEDLLIQAQREIHRIEFLMGSGRSFADVSKYLPWNLINLCRFSLRYGRSVLPTESDLTLEMAYNAMFALSQATENAIVEEIEHEDLPVKIFRILAFQQFWFQESLTGWEMGRQLLLFKNIKTRYNAENKFLEFTGLTIDEFLEMAFMLFSSLKAQETKYIDYDRYLNQYLCGKYPKEKYDLFFKQLARTPREFRRELEQQLNKAAPSNHDIYDLSIFTRFPFIQVEKGYAVISLRMFELAIRDFVYNTLRYYDRDNFCQEFGKSYQERYIANSFSMMGLDYLSDSNLKKQLQYNGPQCDFVIPYPTATILVESKGILVKPILKTKQGNDYLSNYLAKDIVKAVVQAYKTAELLLNDTTLLSSAQKQEFYAVIVTYEELFLGTGYELWDEFLGNLVNQEIESSVLKTVLPPENIFFITLDTLDLLTHLTTNHQFDFLSIFQKAKLDAIHSNSLWISFDKHLSKHYRLQDLKLPHLEAAFKTISDKISERLEFSR